MLRSRYCRPVRAIILCAALLAACAPRVPPTAPPPATPSPLAGVPSGFPDQYYRNAQKQRKILHIDANRSLVAIAVHRGGPFARLGHEHIVASHHVAGYADPDGGRADLYVPLDRLVVDEPQLRAEARLDTQPSADDIEGTRRNMLTRVLETERFPVALIHAEYAAADRSHLRLTIALHGATRIFEVPVHIEPGTTGMTVSGQVSFNQSDFGMVPMSILGGAIQVQDRLDLHFRIVAI